MHHLDQEPICFTENYGRWGRAFRIPNDAHDHLLLSATWHETEDDGQNMF